MTEFEQNLSEQILAVFAEYGVTAKKAGAGKAIRDLLTSHARPAAGWRKAEPGQTFEDGDLILCAVPLMPRGFDYCVLSVKCDEGYFRLDLDGEPWGWEWSDVAWWMPCPKAPAAAQAERGDSAREAGKERGE